MLVTIYTLGLVIGLPVLIGMVVGRLLDWRRPVTEDDWIDAPFVGLATIIIPLQNGFYFGLPVQRTAIPLLALFVAAAAMLALPAIRRGSAWVRAVPTAPFLVALGAYAIQGVGLLIVGVPRYLGRGWSDQFNYVAMAEFILRYPAGAAFADWTTPFASVASRFLDMRIGQSVLLAFFARVSGGDTKAMFEPVILLSVFLLVLAIWSIARAAGLPRALALGAAAVAGVLPAVAYVHLESFLSHALALPLLTYVIVLCHRVVRTGRTADFIKTALITAAIASVYLELLPLVAACVAVIFVAGWWTAPSFWRWAIKCALVLAGPFLLNTAHAVSVIFVGVGAPVLGIIYPWAFRTEGAARLWLGDLVSVAPTGPARAVRVYGVALSAVGYVGLLAHLVWSTRRPAASAADRTGHVTLALLCCGIAAVPLAIAARDLLHPYQFYKLALTIAPLLALGLACLASLILVRFPDGGLPRVAIALGACIVGLPAAWGTLTMGLDTARWRPALAPLERYHSVPWTLSPAFSRLEEFLEAQHNRDVGLCVGDATWSGAYLNAWFSYFARDNRIWLLNPRVNDLRVDKAARNRHLAALPPGRLPELLVTSGSLGGILAEGSGTPPTVWRAGEFRVLAGGGPPFALACHASLRTKEGVEGADMIVSSDERELIVAANAAASAWLVLRGADAVTATALSSVDLLVNGVRAVASGMPGGAWSYQLALRPGLNRLTFQNTQAPADEKASPVTYWRLSGVRLILGGDWFRMGRIDNANGVERDTSFWMGGSPTTVEMLAGRGGEVEVQLETYPGPSARGPSRRLRVETDEGYDRTLTVVHGVVTWQMPVSPGPHVLRLSALDEASVVVPNDRRPLVIGARVVAMKMRPR